MTEPEMPAFIYIDGRFMYAALLRELGTGPAYRLTEQQAAELAANSPYAKARYRVRAKVPAMWDTCGVLGAQLDDGEHWHYPNRPGAIFETWCDAVELHTARGVGWRVDVLEGIQLSKGRPADTFRDRLLKAREHLANVEVPEHVADMGRAAMRAILLQTVGVWHSRGRDRTVVAWTVDELPPHAIQTMREYNATNQVGETVPAYVYRERAGSNQQAEAFRRPELSSQVWARARARIFLGPSADPSGQKPNLPLSSGALEVDPAYLLGINGDALYVGSKTVPTWALPTDQGGGDDGREGRLRLRGYLPGPIATPATDRDRNRLRAQAEAGDWSAHLRAPERTTDDI